MTDETSQEGLKQRITRQGEDALGKLAQDLLENPLLNGALTHALDAQKKAAQASGAREFISLSTDDVTNG